MLKGYKTLIFDFDGTLHQSMHIYEPAFRAAFRYLVEKHDAKEINWPYEAIKSYLGQNPKDMWASFGDQYSEPAKQEASQCITHTMKALIDEGKAKLYEGALETLDALKKRGYTMLILSNTKSETMDKYRELFELDRYFDRYICSDTVNYAPKEEVVQSLLCEYEGKFVIIGDRHHDMRAGQENGITTIACLYGFGHEDEFKNADIHIHDIRELMTLLKN